MTRDATFQQQFNTKSIPLINNTCKISIDKSTHENTSGTLSQKQLQSSNETKSQLIDHTSYDQAVKHLSKINISRTSNGLTSTETKTLSPGGNTD